MDLANELSSNEDKFCFDRVQGEIQRIYKKINGTGSDESDDYDDVVDARTGKVRVIDSKSKMMYQKLSMNQNGQLVTESNEVPVRSVGSHVPSVVREPFKRARSETEKKLFVFIVWQKHIECRKALLQNLHYPTEEKLKSSPTGKSKGYLDILIKESKDEGKEQRFKKYDQYFLPPTVVNSVKDVLESLKEPINGDCLDFSPSLTPCSSYLDVILEMYQDGNENHIMKLEELPELSRVTFNILKENFKEQSIDYIIRPKMYKETLTGENYEIIYKTKSELINIKLTSENTENLKSKVEHEENVKSVKFPEFSKSKKVVFIRNPFDYWILKHAPDEKLFHEFKSDVFSKMSVNFRWFLVECSSMLEMNVRELYKELTFVENRMKGFVKKLAQS